MFQYFLGSKPPPEPTRQIDISELDSSHLEGTAEKPSPCSICTGWSFIEDVGQSTRDMSHTFIDREYCILEDAKAINAKEAGALRDKLEVVKKQKKICRETGKADTLVLLKIVEIKTKIAFLEGIESELCGKGANGAKFIMWNKADGVQKKIAVFKLSNSIETHEFNKPRGEEVAVDGNYCNRFLQMFGRCTQTSQRAVVCGAGSQNREPCAEKAGFMIADKFHREIIAYIAAQRRLKPLAEPDFDEKIFTPMIAGVIELMGVNRDKISVGSLAILVQNAIDADVAHELANILNKNLSQREAVMFQLFVIYDYLTGNTDRHDGNWMVRLSCKLGTNSRVEIQNPTELQKLHSQMNLNADDYTIEAIIPIDNGNILPTKEFGSQILDSKQYAWRQLKFATVAFCDEVVNFMSKINLDDAWVQDICKSINEDAQIKKLCCDIGGVLINSESIAQMKLRARKLKEIGQRLIKTPKELAEAPLYKGWL